MGGGQPARPWSGLPSVLRAERRYNKALGDTDADGGGGESERVSQQSPPSSSILVYKLLTRRSQEVVPRASGLERTRWRRLSTLMLSVDVQLKHKTHKFVSLKIA